MTTTVKQEIADGKVTVLAGNDERMYGASCKEEEYNSYALGVLLGALSGMLLGDYKDEVDGDLHDESV
jgi:hypothetical protein